MKVIDFYSPFIESLPNNQDVKSRIKKWMLSLDYQENQMQTAFKFIKQFDEILATIESAFARTLPGEIHLIPSLGSWDGFAKFDHGTHTVYLGVDHPDSNLDYLKALTAHELSHVYRDHQPEVWKHLGKPISSVTRPEYLDGQSAHEHLASEGLATLFSQKLFPEIAPKEHFYYSELEWQWCLKNHSKIHESLVRCLKSNDQNVWDFYSEDHIEPGSPSRTHYYWAASQIDHQLKGAGLNDIVQLHQLSAKNFKCFQF